MLVYGSCTQLTLAGSRLQDESIVGPSCRGEQSLGYHLVQLFNCAFENSHHAVGGAPLTSTTNAGQPRRVRGSTQRVAPIGTMKNCSSDTPLATRAASSSCSGWSRGSSESEKVPQWTPRLRLAPKSKKNFTPAIKTNCGETTH